MEHLDIFKISEYITLKLENGQTNIYVAGALFMQCKYLLLTIPNEQVEELDEIDSIDEIAEFLDKSLEMTPFNQSAVIIPPKVEFWGHCSNIQAWVENEYDTRILHSNLAFPLLKQLTIVGDPKAKMLFQEEICKRFESFYPSTIKFLLSQRYIQYLTKEQKRYLLEQWMDNDLETAFIYLIGNNLIREFGEQFRPMLTDAFMTEVDRRETLQLDAQFSSLLKTLGLKSQNAFLEKVLSGENILETLFNTYYYPIPDPVKPIEKGINTTHLMVLQRVKNILFRVAEKNNLYRTILLRNIKQLFEEGNIGIVYVLLQYEFYEFIPLSLFKKMLAKEPSPFVNALFGIYGHELLMSYYATFQTPYPFLFEYLDNEGLKLIANKLKLLAPLEKRRVFMGFTKSIRNKTFQQDILRLVRLVLREIIIRTAIPFRPIHYKKVALRNSLNGPDDIVIKNDTIHLLTTVSWKTRVYTYHQEGGFTRAMLFSLIYKAYNTFYRENKKETNNDHISSIYLPDIYLIGIFYDPDTHDVWLYESNTAKAYR
jgi:hypothetical protein